MKTKFLFIAMLFSSQLANGQNYLPFQFGNTRWMVNEANMFRTKTYNYFSMDTTAYLVSGHYYYRLEKQASPTYSPTNSWFYMRNDTVNQRVYVLPQMSPIEYLFYDFDVVTGDTVFNIYNEGFSFADTVLIDSVQSKIINGIARRHIYLHSINTLQARLWIEGIGSDYDLLYPSILFTDPSYFLVCQEYKGFINYGNSVDCNNFMTKVDDKFLNNKITVYPNPVHDIVRVQFDDWSEQDYNLQLLDLQGRVFFNKKISAQTTEIGIAALRAGVYLLKVVSSPGEILYVEKISKQ